MTKGEIINELIKCKKDVLYFLKEYVNIKKVRKENVKRCFKKGAERIARRGVRI